MADIHSKVIIMLFFVDYLLGFVRNLGFVIFVICVLSSYANTFPKK